jgi:hypothetical protein
MRPGRKGQALVIGALMLAALVLGPGAAGDRTGI